MTITPKFTFTPKHQLFILMLLAVGLNFNTLFNDYAVDDIFVMTENSIVQKGLAGIPELLTTDLLHGFKGENVALTEGRYRPFSLILFAVEYQFFGTNPHISHLINVMLFVILICLMYVLLQNYLFRNSSDYLAFITCLLFVVHPVHTEVIANVKSRDELVTFILLIVSLISFIRYNETRRRKRFIAALVCFFLAMLTRESAVTFIAVVPLVFYFFYNQTIKQNLLYAVPLLFITAIYLVIRFLIVGNIPTTASLDILNSPYLYASHTQAFATKVFVLLKYLVLLVLPHPLSWDYGMNQIPYIGLNSFQFITAAVVLVSIFTFAVYTFKQKSIYSFCILYFFITISIAGNFIVDIGTPLSERLLFQPSLAFCLAAASAFVMLRHKAGIVSNVILAVVLILFSFKTVARNADWKNEETIYCADVITAPRSLKTLCNLSRFYMAKATNQNDASIKNTYFKLAVKYALNAGQIFNSLPHPKAATDVYETADVITAYTALLETYPTVELWLKDNGMNPEDPTVKKITKLMAKTIYNRGNGYYEQNNLEAAIQCYHKTVELNKNHVEAWYSLGGMYFLKGDTTNAILSWKEVTALDPNHKLTKEDFSN